MQQRRKKERYNNKDIYKVAAHYNNLHRRSINTKKAIPFMLD